MQHRFQPTHHQKHQKPASRPLGPPPPSHSPSPTKHPRLLALAQHRLVAFWCPLSLHSAKSRPQSKPSSTRLVGQHPLPHHHCPIRPSSVCQPSIASPAHPLTCISPHPSALIVDADPIFAASPDLSLADGRRNHQRQLFISPTVAAASNSNPVQQLAPLRPSNTATTLASDIGIGLQRTLHYCAVPASSA